MGTSDIGRFFRVFAATTLGAVLTFIVCMLGFYIGLPKNDLASQEPFWQLIANPFILIVASPIILLCILLVTPLAYWCLRGTKLSKGLFTLVPTVLALTFVGSLAGLVHGIIVAVSSTIFGLIWFKKYASSLQ